MRTRDRLLHSLCFLLLPLLATPAASLVFEVDRVDDVAALFGCDSAVMLDCSLRTAITLANANPGPDEIVLPAATFEIEIAGIQELNNQTGDLNVLDDVVIRGTPGARPLITTVIPEQLLDIATGVSFELRDVDLFRTGSSNSNIVLRSGGQTLVKLESVNIERQGVVNDAMRLFGTTELRDVVVKSPNGRALDADGDVYIEDSEFEGHVAVFSSDGASLSLIDSVVEWTATSSPNNLSSAVRFVGGDLWIEGTEIRGSEIESVEGALPATGLFVSNASGAVTIIGSHIRGFAGTNGGGIIVQSAASVTVEDSLIEQNSASAGMGGGMRLLSLATNSYATSISGTTFTGNEAPGTLGEGGAIHVDDDLTLVVHNSTFSGNDARFGGAIWAASMTDTSLVHVTMSDQTSSVGGAIFSLGTVDFESSLISGDCAGAGLRTSFGSNLESPGDTCGFNLSSDRPSIADPALAPLADNGGPTPTRLPFVGSLARDFANCALAVDQRGAARPFDGGGGLLCDAGAVEAGSSPPGWIFGDGFESGSVSAWTAVQD